MINIKPIQAIHPEDNFFSSFVSNSIESYGEIELYKKQKELNNYLNLVSPTFDLDIPVSQRYNAVKRKFENYKKRGILKKDLRPYLYIYRQEINSDCFTGLICGVSIDNYLEGYIKPHEDILQKRKSIFTNYLRKVEFQSEPVLLTYKKNNKLQQLISLQTHNTPQITFETDDQITHSIWVVKDRLILHQFMSTFKGIGDIYVADGHHRLESSIEYSIWKRKMEKDYTGFEPFNYFLAYFLPGNEVKIFDFNRLVKDLNGISKDEFILKLESAFLIERKGKQAYFPTQKHHFCMYLDGEFYGLFLKHELRSIHGIKLLDAYQLEKHVLKNILNIKDVRKTNRLFCIPGNGTEDGLLKLKESVDSGDYKVGFGLYPIPIHELQSIADQKLFMPPKSTFILPKLKCGMLIHQLNLD